MTRINCIPPSELTDKHLVAEYRELPRVFGLARLMKGNEEAKWPTKYTLGKGHVLFFYDKLGYLKKRHGQLIEEMKRRGFNPKFTNQDYIIKHPLIDKNWSDWEPTEEALQLNRQRIKERLNEKLP